MEVWKDIKGYENKYQISNLGKVRNTNTKKLYITSIDTRGYYRINLYNNLGEYKTFRVHRLLGIAFIPNPNNYPCINHIDGNKANNDLSNLEWCTHQQNTIHAVQNKLRIAPSKEKHGRALLNIDLVNQIRNNALTLNQAKALCNISKTQYYRVKRGIGWN